MDEREQVKPSIPRLDCGLPEHALLESTNTFLRSLVEEGWLHRLEQSKYSVPPGHLAVSVDTLRLLTERDNPAWINAYQFTCELLRNRQVDTVSWKNAEQEGRLLLAEVSRLREEVQALRGDLAEQLGRLAGARLTLRRAGQVIAWQCFDDCQAFSAWPKPVPAAAVVIAEIKHLLTMPADHIQEPDDGLPRT